MKKISCTAIVLLAAISSLAYGKKAATLPGLSRPAILIVKSNNIFVLEDTTVLIYALKDFKLIKKFGKKGEGPGEFVYNANNGRPMSMSLNKNNILVNSFGRMSYFDVNGKYLREKKVTADALLFPIKNKFVGIGPINDSSGKQFIGFRLIEENFKDWKILYSSDLDLGNRMRQLLLPIVSFTYNPVYKDKIYINAGTLEFLIDVFDSNGNKLYSIKKKVQKHTHPKRFQTDMPGIF